MYFGTSTSNLIHFTLSQNEFNYVLSCVELQKEYTESQSICNRIMDKMLKKSLLDKNHNEMKCALNDNDFYELFMMIITNGMINDINTPVDYFNRCKNDPDVKPWITKSRKY